MGTNAEKSDLESSSEVLILCSKRPRLDIRIFLKNLKLTFTHFLMPVVKYLNLGKTRIFLEKTQLRHFLMFGES